MNQASNIWITAMVSSVFIVLSAILVGQLHVLGPDGIPEQLQRLQIVKAGQLRENPTV